MSDLRTELFSYIQQTPLAPKCYLVGGFLRDQILGRPSKDFDFCVEAKDGAEALCKDLHQRFAQDFSSARQMGAQYPIWQCVWKGLDIQFADTHRENYPDSNSRHRELVFASKEEDCKRRDFTINMLYQNVASEDVLDLCGSSLKDLRENFLRCHPDADPNKVLFEDPLRILRFIRFQALWGCEAEFSLLEALKNNGSRIKVVSAERIRDELIKICEQGKLSVALEKIRELDILKDIFPEALPMIGCEQDKIYHSEGDVWVHTLRVIENAPNGVELQMAAFLHDIGKPATQSFHGERIKFLGHEDLSEKIAHEILRRLKFSTETTDRICKLIKLHLRGGDALQWKGHRAARKLLRDVYPLEKELLALIKADSLASLDQNGKNRLGHIEALEEKLKEAQSIPLSRKPILNGKEILSALQIPSGPLIGEIHEALLQLEDDWASDGKVLDKETALAWLKKKYQ